MSTAPMHVLVLLATTLARPSGSPEDDSMTCLPRMKADCSGAACIIGGKRHGCLEPPPVPGQCSFARQDAIMLCHAWPLCAAVNCAASRLDCQARGKGYILRQSFGDAEVFIPSEARQNLTPDPDQTDQGRYASPAVCKDRLQRVRGSIHETYSGAIYRLQCSPEACSLHAAPSSITSLAERRIRRLYGMRRLIEADSLLLYTPVNASDAHAVIRPDVAPLPGEVGAYQGMYQKHYFVSDSQYIYSHFFENKRDGFFLEVGGLDGTTDGSNSFFFERYMQWRGLLVEASPINFAKLVMRRPFSYRLEAALGNKYGTVRFSGDGCCGKTVQGVDGYDVRMVPVGSLLRAMSIKHIDFWSLDGSCTYPTALPPCRASVVLSTFGMPPSAVCSAFCVLPMLLPSWQVEGGELTVLQGMDWSISVSVLLIESVNEPIRKFLRERGFKRHQFRSISRMNEIWVNQEIARD